jgi:hypothetical protein
MRRRRERDFRAPSSETRYGIGREALKSMELLSNGTPIRVPL